MDGAKKTCAPLALLLFLCIFNHGDGAPISAPAPSPSSVECFGLIIADMADCLSFVQSSGTSGKPSALCCSGLKNVVKVDAECICLAFQQAQNYGPINMTQAEALPSLCGVNSPFISSCTPPSPSSSGSGVNSTSAGSPQPSTAFIQLPPTLEIISSRVLFIIFSFFLFG